MAGAEDSKDKTEEVIWVYNMTGLIRQFEKFGLFLRPGARF